MTYTLTINDDETWRLADGSGTEIQTGNLPVDTPDDIVDVILDDMGIGSPQRAAFKTLLTQDWEIVDDR